MTTPTEAGTRDLLISTARKLFADKGFDGTSVRAITAEAGTNLGSVTYHFGSKDALYAEVVAGTVGPLVGELLGIIAGPGRPLDRIESVVGAHFEYVTTHAALAPLILRSVLATGVPPATALQSMGQLHDALMGLIREGQADGSLRSGDPALMALTLISPGVHLTIMQRALRQKMGLDLSDPAQRARAMDNLVRFVCAGVASHREGP